MGRMGRPPLPWSQVRVGGEALARGATYDEAAALAGMGKSTLFFKVAEHGLCMSCQGE